MFSCTSFEREIFKIKDHACFNALAIALFQYQASNSEVYSRFIGFLNIKPAEIKSAEQIPFLPIEFFKNNIIKTGAFEEEIVFLSSATGGILQSRHYVKEIKLYEESFLNAFNLFYGNAEEYCILALLPSYSEREGSSLIYMVDKLMQKSGHPQNKFFLYEQDKLDRIIKDLEQQKQKWILFGVSYALIDFCEAYQNNVHHGIVIETGGMKGKRKELIKSELHELIKKGFGTDKVHSEYSMTELMSQAYSFKEGLFSCPPWMKVLIRDPSDPQAILGNGRTGGINIIDLANIHSCAFIATQDLGKTFSNGQFEVIGRFDNSDIRGCNLLVQ